MTPDDQRVRTRGPARPRNLAAGCLAVLVVLASCGLLAKCVRQTDEMDTPPPADVDVAPAAALALGDAPPVAIRLLLPSP